jgi:hypothetical protein
MKCETTNSVLTFILGVLVLLSVVFALRTVDHMHELRALQMAVPENSYMVTVQRIYEEASAYNKKNPSPELTRILQSVETKPAAR